jgi:hypothetical protein
VRDTNCSGGSQLMELCKAIGHPPALRVCAGEGRYGIEGEKVARGLGGGGRGERKSVLV